MMGFKHQGQVVVGKGKHFEYENGWDSIFKYYSLAIGARQECVSFS
jgi:hypothetical protein